MSSKEEVLDIIKGGKVDYVRVEFIDLNGNMRGRSLRRAEFEKIIEEEKGVMFSQALLFMDFEENPLTQSFEDILAYPDLSTFTLIPYLERTAIALSYLRTPDGLNSPYCSRSVLSKATETLGEKGISIEASFEPTFYILDPNTLKPKDEAKAFSSEGLLYEQDLLKNVVKNLETMGIQVQFTNKHYGPGQYELSLVLKEPVQAADSLIMAKQVIRDTGKLFNSIITFMPKPHVDLPTNSMDLFIKLKTPDKKKLVDLNDTYGLHKLYKNFLSGILHHLKAILAFSLPSINSYKRIFDIFTSKVIGISTERHFMIRIPNNFKDTGIIELRISDSLANPYLVLASVIYAGLQGIEEGIEYDIGKEIDKPPYNLRESLYSLDKDTYLKSKLGEELVNMYIKLKMREVESFEKHICDWEFKTYLKTGY
ncbi:MAG: glutamine synthetase family protein [Sulfolobaceae archaeon]|nr:glutamine synthetase family protein [Sulfolobaceae archaeon]